MRVRGAVGVVALVALVGGAGVACGQTVPGSANPVGAGTQADMNADMNANMNFDKLLRECHVVTEQQIADAVGGGYPRPSFHGAVCMWDLEGAPGGAGMATLNWYENGNLRNERSTNDKLGYTTTNTTVQGTLALEIRRPNDPDSCGVSARAADAGVVGWWVNYQPGSAHPDPCGAAKKLVELTVNLAR
ncbi:DUF3558 domain-containing protein [Nocardia paucivorans]|uniref:DUF3558 domain-containing protein n=1 Tax=Nocardia paucivorans TaxID=114259 RepID=UPI0005943E2C|nr:DUF3558 domain-containing protein [Nocardia paucivorans]